MGEDDVQHGPFWAFFKDVSPTFRELCTAKEIVANDTTNDQQFSKHQDPSASAKRRGADDLVRHARQFSEVLEEIDYICGGFIRNNGGHIRTFFDICCAPGGFSKYVLDKTDAIGMGVTLPPEKGGHPMIEELLNTPRFHCQFTDIIDSPMDVHFSTPSSKSCDSGASDARQLADYVIMGGMYQDNKPWLRAQGMELARERALAAGEEPPEEPQARFQDHDVGFNALLVAQLIVALNNLAEDGTLMLTLTSNGNSFNCSVICLLRTLFKRLQSAKVRCMHAHRGAFRMVCHGYNRSALHQHQIMEDLGSVLGTLKTETTVEALSIPGVEGGLPELVEKFGAGLRGLYEPVWGTQLQALKDRFRNSFEVVSANGIIKQRAGAGASEQPARTRLNGGEIPSKAGSSDWRRDARSNMDGPSGDREADANVWKPSRVLASEGNRRPEDHSSWRRSETAELPGRESLGSKSDETAGKKAYVPPHRSRVYAGSATNREQSRW